MSDVPSVTPGTPAERAVRARSGGVQSLERAFTVLELVAAHPGAVSLSELATASGLPPPTLHRLARTMVELGYLRQEASRRYALGPRLALLANSSSAQLSATALPHLARLVEEIGETANLAMLDGDFVAYVAQVPGRHSMRMFTEVGRRVHPHCTAVGKALLARSTDEAVLALLQRTGLPQQTPHTVTDALELIAQLEQVRQLGYAMDEGEQEVGVRCVAVAVDVPGSTLQLAFSVSGPAPRMTADLVAHSVPVQRETAAGLVADLT